MWGKVFTVAALLLYYFWCVLNRNVISACRFQNAFKHCVLRESSALFI